jgi:hypothetical protein
MPYQRGRGFGSIFKTVFRFLLPLAKKAGTSIGRESLRAGAQLAGDILSGANVKKSVKRRARVAAGNLVTKAGNALQKGAGRKKRKRKAPAKKRAKPIKRRKPMKRKSVHKKRKFNIFSR